MRIRRLPPAKAVPLGWRLPQDRARCGVDVSVIAQTGHSEAIHSPDAWPSIVVELMIPATAGRRCLRHGDFVLSESLAHNV